jgi:ABC-type transport system involved in multi-copper enzyme maturation permease subunit
MRQTMALFLDAYRYLNSRKLFWFTLAVSGLIAGVFGALGLNEQGMTIFGWTIEIPGLNSNQIEPEVFYKLAYVNLGVGFWLAWGATILALVSTASMIPDFVSDGSIDLLLSRSVGRVRLFLTKYATGLLFVALQAAAFAGASFLVIGLRAGVWEPGIFIAAPLVILFFSYLYSVCALLGLMTRSTIASLMLTLGLWFVIFLINTTDQTLLSFKTLQELRVEQFDEQIEQTRTSLDEARGALKAELGLDEGKRLDAEARVDRLSERLDELTENRGEANSARETLSRFYGIVFAVKTALPKTQETISLNERWMVALADLPFDPADAGIGENEGPPEVATTAEMQNNPAFQRRLAERLRERPVWWIIGTSLVFEFVVLGIACWFFKRRDF